MGTFYEAGLMYGVKIRQADLINDDGTPSQFAQTIMCPKTRWVTGWERLDMEGELAYFDVPEEASAVVGYDLGELDAGKGAYGSFAERVPKFSVSALEALFKSTRVYSAIVAHAPHIAQSLGIYLTMYGG